MEELKVDYISNEKYKVSLTNDGIEAHCFVSSMHLVEDKRKQLLECIHREAANAYTSTGLD
jgi:ribosome-binding factor A